MLSGFVLSFAYQAKLDAGWSTISFFKVRVARLYPLYFVGLVLGLLLLISVRAHHNAESSPLLEVGLGLLILPMGSRRFFSGTTAFPLNFPSWSIFFELIANLVHAAFLRRRTTRALSFLALGSLAAMALWARRFGTINEGANSPENVLCIFRVLFSYTAGMLLYRCWRSGWWKLKFPPVLIALALLAALALPVGIVGHRARQELLIIVFLFPTLILAASVAHPSPWWNRPFQVLGQASYALYILHGPLLQCFERGWAMMTKHRVNLDAPWTGLFFLTLLMACALLIDRIYDAPARGYLRRKLAGAGKTT